MKIEDIIIEKKKINYSHKQVVNYLLKQGFELSEIKTATEKFYKLEKKEDVIYSHSFMFSFFNLLVSAIVSLFINLNVYTCIAVVIQSILLFFYTKLNKLVIIIFAFAILLGLINVLSSRSFGFRGFSLKVYVVVLLTLNLICLYNVYKQKLKLDKQYTF